MHDDPCGSPMFQGNDGNCYRFCTFTDDCAGDQTCTALGPCRKGDSGNDCLHCEKAATPPPDDTPTPPDDKIPPGGPPQDMPVPK